MGLESKAKEKDRDFSRVSSGSLNYCKDEAGRRGYSIINEASDRIMLRYGTTKSYGTITPIDDSEDWVFYVYARRPRDDDPPAER